MDSKKIGNSQAIAIIVTMTVSQLILNILYNIVSQSKTAAIINIIYIGIIVTIVSYIIVRLLSKFPTFDILDISDYLYGKIFKTIIGFLFLAYFLFFTAMLLYNFSCALQIIYFPSTKISYIILFLLLIAVLASVLKNNAIYKNGIVVLFFTIVSIILLFIFNINNIDVTNIFPILGNGFYSTFFIGLGNIYAFQGILYLFFLPSKLNSPKELNKIVFISCSISILFAIFAVGNIILSDKIIIDTYKLIPLYTVARKISFGNFFRRTESLFLTIWIASFEQYLGITIKNCCNMCIKISNIKEKNIITAVLAFIMFLVTLIPRNYTDSLCFTNTIYKYSFFILTVFSILIIICAISKKNK